MNSSQEGIGGISYLPSMVPEHEEQHPENDADSKSEMTHDSMVTVRLSESPLAIDTKAEVAVLGEGTGLGISTDGAELNDTNESPRITMHDPSGNEAESPGSQDEESRRGSESSEGSDRVNWEELEKTEEQEPRDQGSDDVWTLYSSM